MVFTNGMLLIRCKKQVSGLSPKEAALKTLAQSLNQRGVFPYSEVSARSIPFSATSILFHLCVGVSC